ncbi:MAG: AAA family ATPase [Eubacteriales bacterium]|jgi:hypothetical protein|nr:AAA family ATPase [Eubacteriales bacterium]
MLANENIWIKATDGYFDSKDPAVYGVTKSRTDISSSSVEIDGKNSGFISMNGLVTAAVLAMVRGSYHYEIIDSAADGDQKIIWAEYTPEVTGGKKTEVYVMKIYLKEVNGINYSYMRINAADIIKYDASSDAFVPAWSSEEIEAMPYAPALSLIPVIIGACAQNEEIENRLSRLSHLPSDRYVDNPNLYWLSYHIFNTRSEYYSHMDDISTLDNDQLQIFITKHLENMIGWDFRDLYNVNMSYGDISYEKISKVFSGEVDPDSELGRLVPKINLDDYYIDPKIKGIVDLLVMEKDSNFPINTGMLYGPPASGKSTAVMIIAKILNLPYVPVTFNSNISMDDLLGSWQPTEDGKIQFVESMFVKAYQSPSVVEFVECYYVKPGACGDLNTALDETAQITLPNGKIIYRHPSCFIIATMNAGENENEYRAVREQDVSFDRRFEGFKEYLDFFGEDVFAGMIAKKSGYTNTDEIMLMIRVMKDMNKAAEETGDWQTVYPSAVMRWAQHRKYKDIITAARSTILPNASKNLETQKEILDSIFNNYW